MSALFSWINHVDTSGVTADSEELLLPASHLRDAVIQKLWRTSSATTAAFTSIFAATSVVDVLALSGATLGPADTIRHRLYNAADSLQYDSGVISCDVVSGYDFHAHVLPASEATVKKWVCNIVATSRATEGYFDVGRAWAGEAWVPAIGVAYGWHDKWEDTTDVSVGKYSGVTFVDTGAQYRTLSFNINHMLDADRIEAMEMARYTGVRRQFLAIHDTTGDVERVGMIGRRTKMSEITQKAQAIPAVYDMSFTMKQDL